MVELKQKEESRTYQHSAESAINAGRNLANTISLKKSSVAFRGT